MATQIQTKWTSRKFWGWIFSMVLISALLGFGKLTESTYESLMSLLFVLYFGANVAKAGIDKWSGTIKNNPSITKGDTV